MVENEIYETFPVMVKTSSQGLKEEHDTERSLPQAGSMCSPASHPSMAPVFVVFAEEVGMPTAASIRGWIGDLNHIKIVGKHAARLGQSLSSTTATVKVPPHR